MNELANSGLNLIETIYFCRILPLEAHDLVNFLVGEGDLFGVDVDYEHSIGDHVECVSELLLQLEINFKKYDLPNCSSFLYFQCMFLGYVPTSLIAYSSEIYKSPVPLGTPLQLLKRSTLTIMRIVPDRIVRPQKLPLHCLPCAISVESEVVVFRKADKNE